MTINLTCHELVELLTDYLEGALADDERARFERHLADCGACRTYVEQVQHTIRGIHGLALPEVTSEQRANLLALFRRWRDNQLPAPESTTYDEW